MKTFARFLIGVVVILAFIIFILTSIAKFKVLDKNFWIDILNTPGTYQNIQTAVIAGFEQSAIKEGGNKTQTRNTTKFVTVEFIKDVSEKNVSNTFDYLNGKTDSLVVYFPAKKLSITTVFPEEIDAKMLAAAFTGPNKNSTALIDTLKNTGDNTTLAFIASLVTLVVFSGLHILITPVSKRFKPTGRLFITTSLIVLLLTLLLETFVFKSQMLFELRNGEAIQILLATLLPPVTTEVVLFVRYICIGFLITGLLLLLIKPKNIEVKKTGK